ncbi:hypothetical protein [Marinomonas transparens]|uniref:Uncharacterized protein n=1 Tax=Marinomonas transparens TaxID=2795388 RepID=A0A934N0M1_9GAMM|nr:hypothetical protein [Marinomonas transparens]MBJ7536857.1 hypothetical protein [Marinomonas transparens]
MADTQSVEINKLEKLRAAWLPAVEFLFGEAVAEAQFDGFKVSRDIAKPVVLFENSGEPFRYKIQMPARSFTNDVMLLADVIQEMVRGLYPIGFVGNDAGRETPALCEGAGVYAAVTAIRQVFGEETVDSYLDALREQAFPYYDAFSYVAVLLSDDPQAIKKLRAIQPFLYEVQKADFITADVQVERKFIDVLLFTFRA